MNGLSNSDIDLKLLTLCYAICPGSKYRKHTLAKAI